ncbi:hypothetical protein Tco_0873520 [Tanacetum coccineum]|uniref:Uncharacterized protein n=1 Tax=Tanacetum coccineum TaxID=301880 RepID=A0ABQ5BPN7_9ASTR
MLVPSGGGLILYQAYGNLYAMTGKKSHSLGDKKIPSVGVFDDVFLALRWHLEEKHVTWAHLEKKQTRLRTYTKSLKKLKFTERGDDVAGITRRCRNLSSDGVRDLTTASELQARKLGIPPSPQLTVFELTPEKKKAYNKRKRRTELIHEVFGKEIIVVDGMHRNLVPHVGVVRSVGLVINEPKSGILCYNGNFNLVFQRENEFHLATTTTRK